MPSPFGAPRGARGWLAAQVVARLTGEANEWMVDLLGVGPDDRMLDVGCGPGLAVAHAAEVRGAHAAGVDVSDIMVRVARRRARRLIAAGQVEIRRAEAAALPFPDAAFTAAGSLNSLQFWPSPEAGLAELHRVLEPGGRVALVVMDRRDDLPDSTLPAWLGATMGSMEMAGFVALTAHARPFGGVVHRALVGRRPERRMAPHSTPRRTG